jgi:aminopeptidase N
MNKITFLLVCLLTFGASAQTFTKSDTLKGSVTPERAWWDLLHYQLSVTVDPESKAISGSNTVTYRVDKKHQIMQIDLQAPMSLDKVIQDKTELSYTSIGNAHFIRLEKEQKIGEENTIMIHFSGIPREAKNAPWDGGFSWKTDKNGKPFVATSNQGIGSSVWWPNKDHPADEPDLGVDLKITAPKDLIAVGNGRLVDTRSNEDTKTWHWKVVSPINNYGINVNIADYVKFGETYNGLNGELDLEYWVLSYDLSKAIEQFKQVPMMLEAFEYWFGPYPFYEDSFKLVEVPYLGMEHQSSVTYGNMYRNGYLGRDLSNTGWGLKFDFIIIHEAGHEWFANNITNKDVADMWIHEGFTAYSENLYLDYHFGKEAASAYVIGTRSMIENNTPMIGKYGVDNSGGIDIYYKGANILHTLRQLLEDDDKWRAILTGLNTTFRHQTVSSKQLENYISKVSGIDLTEFWQQYLRTTMIPKVEYKIDGNTLQFRYTDIIDKFDMPVIAIVNGKEEWIFPTANWKTKEFEKAIETFSIKKDFYVKNQKSY